MAHALWPRPASLWRMRITVAGVNSFCYAMTMMLAEVVKEALALPENERALLAVSLLETLPPPEPDLSDDEVLERDAHLESGRAEEISHQEFIRRIERERG